MPEASRSWTSACVRFLLVHSQVAESIPEFPVGLAGWSPAHISKKGLGTLLLHLLLAWGLHVDHLVARVLWTSAYGLLKEGCQPHPVSCSHSWAHAEEVRQQAQSQDVSKVNEACWVDSIFLYAVQMR